MPDYRGQNQTVGDMMSRDYNPLQAGGIAAGAAAQSGLDQIQRAYLLARLGLAGRWQGPEAENEIRARLAALSAERAESARLYQPMREAMPYATAIGEAIPAYAMGRGAGNSALRWNAGTTILDDLTTVGRMLARR